MSDMISLSLQGASITLFKLDGPALRLKRQGEATRWFPLRRLRHVCITGQLTTGLETLFKLAEKRIPVTLFSTNGELRCQLLHPHSSTAGFSQLLEESEHDAALKDAREQWLINSQLQAFAHVGIQKGDIRLAKAAFTQQLGEMLNKLKLQQSYADAEQWMHGISQTGINRLLDSECQHLHGQQRSTLHNQLNQITWPLTQEATFNWLIKNQHKAATPANLHNAFSELEQTLMPWFKRCLAHLETALEQASYSPTVNTRQRRG